LEKTYIVTLWEEPRWVVARCSDPEGSFG